MRNRKFHRIKREKQNPLQQMHTKSISLDFHSITLIVLFDLVIFSKAIAAKRMEIGSVWNHK